MQLALPNVQTGECDIKGHLAVYGALLSRNANVRYLWLAQVVSLFGDWFNFIAAAELITELSSAGSAISLLVGIRTLAPVLGAPVAPYIAARVPHRTVLILSDLLRIGSVLALLLVDDPGELWLLYTLLSVQGFLAGIFHPVRMAILPDVVANEAELGAANTLDSLSWTAMIALGTALGGVATTYLGIRVAFVMDAFTFLLSALLLLQLKYLSPRTSARGVRNPLYTDNDQKVTFRDLLRFLQQEKDFLWLILKKTVAAVFSYNPVQVLHIMLSKLYPHIGPGSLLLGVIFSVGGIVSFFSPIVFRLFTGDNHRRMRKAMLLAYFTAALGMFLQGFIPPFALLLVGLALSAVGEVIIWTFSSQLLLSLTPVHLREHIFSLDFLMFNLLGVLGVAIPEVMVEQLDQGIMGAYRILTVSFVVFALLWGLWLKKGKYRLAPALSETF